MNEAVEGIRRRHAGARPNPTENPAWANSELDLGLLLGHYDALAAQLAELRKHLGTLTPGGSHTCITCAAHCVAIGDMEARIAALEAALRDLVDYSDPTKHVDADAVTERVRRARAVLGLTAETKGEQNEETNQG